MEKLALYLNELEKTIPNQASMNAAISKREVAWHIDHSLKVINSVTNVLKKSDPKDYQWHFNAIRHFVFLTGHIPRGKGKAPKAVQSFEDITVESLLAQLEQAKLSVKELEQLESKNNFKHPYFGILNRKQTIKFLGLHTKHHLRIVQDIIA